MTAIEGGTVKIECRTTGKPEPRIEWLKDGLPFKDPSGSGQKFLR